MLPDLDPAAVKATRQRFKDIAPLPGPCHTRSQVCACEKNKSILSDPPVYSLAAATFQEEEAGDHVAGSFKSA
jgi:hypothetical protein